MTTPQEVDNQIKADLNRFWQAPYEGKLPADIMFKFRQALMFHNAQSLNASPQMINDLLTTKEYDLKFVHVGIILNIVFSIPFNAVYDSPEQAMDALIEFKEIEVEFNSRVDRNSKILEKKRNKLMEIISPSNTIKMNGSPRK